MNFFVVLILFFSTTVSIAIAEEMTFRIVSDGGNQYDCCWVVAKGEVTENTPANFETFVEEEDLKGGLLRIVGSGSDIPAAMDLGRLIRNGNFSTTVGASVNYYGPWYEELDEGVCTAGCAIAFFGGNRRLVPAGAELKFTQFQAGLASSGAGAQTLSSDEAIKSRIENQIRTGEVVSYLVDMGIDLRAYTLAASVNPRTEPTGRLVARDLLLDYKIDNASDQPSNWFAEPLGNWFRVKTETSLTDRAITLHCSQRSGYVLGFEADQQSILNIQGAVRDKSGTILFSTRDSQFNAKVLGYTLVGPDKGRVEFSIDERAAQSISVSDVFDFASVDQVANRSTLDVLAFTFAMRGMQADSRLTTRILELCVE